MSFSEMRARARDRLKGFWGLAIGTVLIASIFGGASNSGISPILNLIARYEENYGDPDTFIHQYAPFLLAGLSAAGTIGLVQFVLGGPVALGLKTFFLKLNRRQPAQVGDLFSRFDNFLNGFLLQLLTNIFITLWTLLLIVPGIIAAYSYAMAPYLMAEDPKLSAMDAIRTSKQMMKGHKLELFCLGLTFIGWALLCILTLGIGYLWLVPYIEASYAGFYDDLKNGTARTDDQRPYQGPEF